MRAGMTPADKPQTPPKTFHVKSFGCQMNVYDGERMAELMAADGMTATDDPDRADLVALGLGDAAGDRDHRRGALVEPGVLAQPADVRIDLFGRAIADVAGVEDDQIGAVGIVGRRHPVGRHQFGHTLAVIDVHLAAERLDVEGPGRVVGFVRGGHAGAHTGCGGRSPACNLFRPLDLPLAGEESGYIVPIAPPCACAICFSMIGTALVAT